MGWLLASVRSAVAARKTWTKRAVNLLWLMMKERTGSSQCSLIWSALTVDFGWWIMVFWTANWLRLKHQNDYRIDRINLTCCICNCKRVESYHGCVFPFTYFISFTNLNSLLSDFREEQSIFISLALPSLVCAAEQMKPWMSSIC